MIKNIDLDKIFLDKEVVKYIEKLTSDISEIIEVSKEKDDLVGIGFFI